MSEAVYPVKKGTIEDACDNYLDFFNKKNAEIKDARIRNAMKPYFSISKFGIIVRSLEEAEQYIEEKYKNRELYNVHDLDHWKIITLGRLLKVVETDDRGCINLEERFAVTVSKWHEKIIEEK